MFLSVCPIVVGVDSGNLAWIVKLSDPPPTHTHPPTGPCPGFRRSEVFRGHFAEQLLQRVNGSAPMVCVSYSAGLGACLPVCRM